MLKSVAVVVLAVSHMSLVSLPVEAAPGWDPGRIIDDSIFTNKGAMSVQDIQNFLNSKVPVCDTNHPPGPNAQGTAPPWTCLKNYHENPDTGANNLNGAPVPAGGISAAQIIWNYAQAFTINPQVLLVTLQKENGLITDTWPYPHQYRTAMGFACPDTASCNPAYYGFAKQVYQAARYFRNFYDENPNWTVPYKVGVRHVLWSPDQTTSDGDPACGGANVTITTHATGALYSYTPYQPNAASLAAGYGTGDNCSSYGNRNFFNWFNDWFGSTYNPTYYAGYNWKFENLDGSVSPISGSGGRTGQTPTSINFNSALHIFYYSAATHGLQHAYADGTGWHFENLDGAGGADGRLNANVGVQASVITYNNALHVFYYDIAGGDLRHGWSNSSGTGWQFETLDGNGVLPGSKNANLGLNPTATAYGAGLQLFYYDQDSGNLRHAWITTSGDNWHFENLDGDPGAIGHKDATLGLWPKVTTHNSTLQLFYYDQSNGNLRHAWTDATGWRFENLDGDPGAIGRKDATLGLWPTVTVYNSSLQLAYYDQSNGNLRHAWTDATGWRFENLDGDPGSLGRKNANLGLMPTIAPADDKLYILYYDQTGGNMRSAAADLGGWRFANLDGDNGSLAAWNTDTGLDATATLFNGTLQVYYFDATNGGLRHAWGTQ